MSREGQRRCGECGEPLGEGAAFCRACGAKHREPAADDAPTVREALPAVEPPPLARAAAKPAQAPPTPRQAPPPAKAAGAEPPPLPPIVRSPRPSRTPLLVGAAILVLGAVVAGALLVTQGGSSGSDAPPTSEAGASTPSQEVSAQGEAEPAAETGFPPVSRAQMREEIQSLLIDYHEDVVNGAYQSAWALLSPRKRQQYLEEGGYHKWMAAQASLSPYLSPAGLTVQLDALEGEGVARAMVTGMGWSKPGSPCEEWSGLTWTRYDGEAWTYDPGYSTTPARRRTWEPRFHELLGADC